MSMPVATTIKKPTMTRKPKVTALSRKRNCFFCLNPEFEPDYKDTARLRRYINDRNRIMSQTKTRTCARHQRALANAIRQARTMALFA
jgi:small subunit ribosomal protein S18